MRDPSRVGLALVQVLPGASLAYRPRAGGWAARHHRTMLAALLGKGSAIMDWGEREQAEAWAKIIAQGYAEKAVPGISPQIAASLEAMLTDTLHTLLNIAVDPRSWPTDIDMPGTQAEIYPNPKIRQWERQVGLRPGPRLVGVAPDAMKATMSPPGQR